MMRVGIYPGAFDPIHEGHIAFAEACIQQYQLDKVFFLPEPRPRHKQAVKAFEHRQRMVQIAIDDNPKYGLIIVEQQKFTVHETWPSVTARFADASLFMLLGSDVAHRLATWPHIDELIRMAPHFLIAARSGAAGDVDDMVSVLRQTTKVPFEHSIVTPNYQTFNSLDIRKSLKSGKVPAGLNRSVAAYILSEQLYISGAI